MMTPVTTTESQTPPESGESADFGFRRVRAEEKETLVRGVFDAVAGQYDLMNDLMSAGVHRLWKRELIRMVRPRAGETLLDVAGGTGDIAFRFLDAAMARPAVDGAETRVIVCDINEEMVRVGRDRAVDKGHLTGIEWTVGNAEALPVADGSVDAYTISFGLRNVTHIDRALAEARRVLKPGGRFFSLEFSHVVIPVLDRIYDTYSFSVLPVLGQIVAGNREAYQYLVESIRRFPRQPDLVARMEEAGLSLCRYANLSGGIAAIHSGRRI